MNNENNKPEDDTPELHVNVSEVIDLICQELGCTRDELAGRQPQALDVGKQLEAMSKTDGDKWQVAWDKGTA